MRLKIFIPLFLFILIIALLPFLVSIPPFKQLFIRAMERKTGAQIQIDRLHFSWLGPQRLQGVHVRTPQIEGDIVELSSKVPFWSIADMGRSLDTIHATGKTYIAGGSGEFSVQGNAFSRETFDFNFQMTEMPSAAIDQFFNTKNLAILTIGPHFNATGSASLHLGSGGFDLDISSPSATAAIRATFTPKAIILREPLILSLLITPALTKDISKYLSVPSLSLESVDPARLYIDSKGFYLPLPYSPSTLQIAQGNLDLSRIRINNGSFLIPLFKFLKARLTTQKIDAWLTALDFTLYQGQLDIGRLDALIANSTHLCGWGSADLSTQQLDLIFGIPSDTLSKSLGIKNVSSKYVLQIPIKGTFRSPDFDIGTASAKIAALIATGHLQKQSGILGGVSSLISQVSEDKAPPPKKPFPWE